jgi:hypothetical protein
MTSGHLAIERQSSELEPAVTGATEYFRSKESQVTALRIEQQLQRQQQLARCQTYGRGAPGHSASQLGKVPVSSSKALNHLRHGGISNVPVDRSWLLPEAKTT